MRINIILNEYNGNLHTEKTLELSPASSKKVRLEIVANDQDVIAYIDVEIEQLQKALAKIAL